ncbi:uncharacterized protein LOC110019769 [Phalaenopsis equestris]|uniref:uncharacterized protein LOC110019769 n=1 Tax=Phalaenopsis equestris TaxID=78828 RepID=UPI0009E404B5|nr:uncharacterized protein LOC110019769 [Phalaenopsis equestris]
MQNYEFNIEDDLPQVNFEDLDALLNSPIPEFLEDKQSSNATLCFDNVNLNHAHNEVPLASDSLNASIVNVTFSPHFQQSLPQSIQDVNGGQVQAFFPDNIMSIPISMPMSTSMLPSMPLSNIDYQKNTTMRLYNQYKYFRQMAYGSTNAQLLGDSHSRQQQQQQQQQQQLCNNMLLGGRNNSISLASNITPHEASMLKNKSISIEERNEKINRYKHKRSKRNFKKKITYRCRKTIADSRPRVRGRFAKFENLDQEIIITNTNCHDNNENTKAAVNNRDLFDYSDILAPIIDVDSLNNNNTLERACYPTIVGGRRPIIIHGVRRVAIGVGRRQQRPAVAATEDSLHQQEAVSVEGDDGTRKRRLWNVTVVGGDAKLICPKAVAATVGRSR